MSVNLYFVTVYAVTTTKGIKNVVAYYVNKLASYFMLAPHSVARKVHINFSS